VSLGDRITAMSERLAREATRAGLQAGDIERLCRVFANVAETRAVRIGNREHQLVLHTARTVLILIEDCGANDATLLCAAAALDTSDRMLMPELDTLPLEPAETALIGDVCAAVAAEHPLEELLVADPRVRLLAVSEALDHARHLHLQPAAEWPPMYDQACAVHLPIAQRTHDALARRFHWWCDMFRTRYLRD